MNDLQQQLTELRRTVRRQNHSLLGLAVILVVFVLSSASAEDDKVLQVERLEIVDAQNRTLISLGVGDEGRAEILMSAKPDSRNLCIATTELGHAAIDLFNAKGDRVVSLGVTKEGHGGVRAESDAVTPAFYMGRDLRGNGQVPSDVHAGRRLD